MSENCENSTLSWLARAADRFVGRQDEVRSVLVESENATARSLGELFMAYDDMVEAERAARDRYSRVTQPPTTDYASVRALAQRAANETGNSYLVTKTYPGEFGMMVLPRAEMRFGRDRDGEVVDPMV